MSETSPSKSPFDPEKFCECQKCFSIHRRGSVVEELKTPAVVIEPKDCKYCQGTGFRPGDVDRPELGVKRCDHTEPQTKIPF